MVQKIGVKMAIGEFVWACRVAQKHYLDTTNGRSIPLKEWQKQRCADILLEVGLATTNEFGIELSGSEEAFSWLMQKQTAGQKSGEARREKRAKKSKEHSLTGVQRASTFVNGAEPLSSFLSTLSSNLNLSLPSSLLSQFVERVCAEVYPKKIGLKGALKILVETQATKLNTVGDCHDFLSAVTKYTSYITDPANAVQNVYGFKGFAEVWRNWIPESQMKEGA